MKARGNRKPRQLENKEYESNLNDYRLTFGLTIKEICYKAKISTTTYCGLNNGMESPFYKNGEIKPYVEKICRLFKATLAELFPRYVCDLNRKTELTSDQILDITTGETTNVERIFLLRDIDKALATLTKRERFVIIETFFNDSTFTEVGACLGVSGGRVRQIQSKALRKIRAPGRRSFLDPWAIDILGYNMGAV